MKTYATRTDRGFVLTAVLMLLLIGTLVATAMVVASRQTLRTVERWQAQDECLLASQAAMEKVKSNLYKNFDVYNSFTFSWTNIYWLTANASRFSTNGTLQAICGSDECLYPGAVIVATVSNSTVSGSFDNQVLYITNRVTATWKGITRTTEETVRYILSKSVVFDHAYFINNFGWFNSVDMVVNGDIRSNFNIDLNSASLVLNGNSYAGGTNIVRKTPASWTWASYSNNSFHAFFRPGYNVDLNKNNSNSIWAAGYNANKIVRTNKADKITMPYIGNLNDYKYYATDKGGTISNNTAVIVTNVFDGAGPSSYTNAIERTGSSGYTNNSDRGCLVLVGTSNNPIRINGPVVVDGDLIIKGYYTGQGTIYAGRNIHVIGDLISLNPAQWNHPETMSSFTNTTLPSNLTKDFLGLCSKGSIILGDYRDSTMKTFFDTYLKPSFTAKYDVTATDSSIGYVTSYENGTNYFNGDYTANYGTKVGPAGTNSVARKYYEASISDATLGTLAPQVALGRIDAILYNNHATAGKLGTNCLINGGIICRDEGLSLSGGRVYMNWDSRISLDVDFRPYLPMGLAPAKTILWRELYKQ